MFEERYQLATDNNRPVSPPGKRKMKPSVCVCFCADFDEHRPVGQLAFPPWRQIFSLGGGIPERNVSNYRSTPPAPEDDRSSRIRWVIAVSETHSPFRATAKVRRTQTRRISNLNTNWLNDRFDRARRWHVLRCQNDSCRQPSITPMPTTGLESTNDLPFQVSRFPISLLFCCFLAGSPNEKMAIFW